MPVMRRFFAAILSCCAVPALDGIAVDSTKRIDLEQRLESTQPERFGLIDPASTFAAGETSSRGFINLVRFHDVLDRSELASAIDALAIDPDNRNLIVSCASDLYPAFVVQYNDIRSAATEGYLSRCSDLADRSSLEFGTDSYTQSLRDVSRQIESIRNRLQDAEAVLLSNIVACIGERADGRALIEHLLLRSHWRHCAEQLPKVRWADGVDLRGILDALDMPIAERAVVEVLVLQHERVVAEQQPARARAYWQLSPTVSATFARVHRGELAVESITSTTRHARATPMLIGRAIRASAVAVFDRIRLALDVGNRARFSEQVLHTVFPEIYPDPASPAAAFKAAMERSVENPPRLASLRAAHDLWLDRWSIANSQLEQVLLAWTDEEAALEEGFEGDGLATALADALEKRHELDKEATDMIAALSRRAEG